MDLKIETAPVPPPPRTFTLVMSEAEASILLSLAGKVGGPPQSPQRKFVGQIYRALSNADVRSDSGISGTLHVLEVA